MAAPQANRPPREVVEFSPNVPVMVALKFNQGKHVAGQYGDRMMFSLVDGRVMFLAPDVAGRIEELGINVREPFTITQKWDGGKQSPRTWEVAKIAPEIGEQPDGTFAVPKLPPASAVTPARKPPAMASAPRTKLEDALCTVVSAVYAAQLHATAIGFTAMPQFTSEDIRTMANTLIIDGQRAERAA